MDGIRNLFRKKLKDGGPSGEGGHQDINPRRKRGWELVQDGPSEKRNAEARAYIADKKKYDQAKAQAESRYKERQLYVPRKNSLNDIRANQNRYRNMNQGGVASMFRKKLEDGDLSPDQIAQIESYAATGLDASTISSLVGVSEDQVNNVLIDGSTSKVMPVEDEEIVETAEVTEKDPMINLFAENNVENDNQPITTLFTQPEPQGIMAAANGGKAMKKIKGQDHMLAYITPKEADKLVALGGKKTMTKEGIPAYPEYDNYGYSNQKDFDEGNYAASSDPTVRSYADTSPKTDNSPTVTYLTDDGVLTTTKPADDDFWDRDDEPDRNARQLSEDILNKKVHQKRINPTIKDKFDDAKQAYNVVSAMKYGPIGVAYAMYDLNKKEKAYMEELERDIQTLKDAGVAEFHHAVDTPIQTLEQIKTDKLNRRLNKEDDGGPDGVQPYIAPVTLEVDEAFAKGERLDFNMKTALDKIRANQARRSGSVATGNIQDNQIMMANRGGLAGLFRVKNQ